MENSKKRDISVAYTELIKDMYEDVTISVAIEGEPWSNGNTLLCDLEFIGRISKTTSWKKNKVKLHTIDPSPRPRISGSIVHQAALYEDVTTRRKTSDGLTEVFPIKIGLHQGSALNPYRFTLIMDELNGIISKQYYSACCLQMILFCLRRHVKE